MMTKLLRSSSLVLFLLLSLSLATIAQSRKGADKGTLTKETFMDMESVSNPAITAAWTSATRAMAPARSRRLRVERCIEGRIAQQVRLLR